MGKTRLQKNKPRKARVEQLSDKQKRFAQEYRIDHNATQAALRAGYAKSGAEVTGARLLKNETIVGLIAYENQKVAKKLSIEVEEIIQQAWYTLTREIGDFLDEETSEVLPVSKMGARARACIDGLTQDVIYTAKGDRIVRTKLQLTSKMHAIDTLMKHKGLFAAQKVEVKTSVDLTQLFAQPTPVDTIAKQLETIESTATPLPKDVPYTVGELVEEQEE